jgi:lipoprotein-anchoring transpeptidase ErfK/SrfK
MTLRAYFCSLFVALLCACAPRSGASDAQSNAAVAPSDVVRSDDAEIADDAAAVEPSSDGAARAGDGGVGGDAEVEEPFTPPTQIVARGTWVPVRKEPRRDAALAGYLRAGTIVRVRGTRVSRETCPIRRELRREGGWYQLEAGGYVCVGGALAAPWTDERHELRPTQPDLDAGMPYRYAIVYGRTAVFRAIPTHDEMRDNRGWRLEFERRDGGASSSSSSESSSRRRRSSDDDDDDRPRRPQLGDLRGERGSIVVRRLLTGMYVALDRLIRDRESDAVYWRTQSGGIVPAGPLSIWGRWSDFRGAVMGGSTHLPYAFMNSMSGFLYRIVREGRGAELARRVQRHRGVQLAANSEPVVIGENRYWRTEADPNLAVKEANVGLALQRPRPSWIGATERWIDIDLQQQVLTAFDGETPAFATLVSTGRRNNNENEHFNTPSGQYRVYAKHVTTTMDGDTAGDNPYSIEDVPWVMYFHESYAIHGAFWHGQWGWRMSHGCVNMAPEDARWIFNWASPQLPEGWHGIFSGESETGSPVVVHHGDRPPPAYRPRRRRDGDEF